MVITWVTFPFKIDFAPASFLPLRCRRLAIRPPEITANSSNTVIFLPLSQHVMIFFLIAPVKYVFEIRSTRMPASEMNKVNYHFGCNLFSTVIYSCANRNSVRVWMYGKCKWQKLFAIKKRH